MNQLPSRLAALTLLVSCAIPQATTSAAPVTPNEPQDALSASADEPTRLVEQPAVSASHLAFVYAADLWVAKLDGTDVRRLTTHAGQESRPRFSPDGRWIAFSGQYDGNTDVYLVATGGGEPRRLTWHPGDDVVQGFAPDGSAVYFTSQRDVYTLRFWHLFRVPVEGGFPEAIGLPTCFKASVSPDGAQIAYVPLPEAFNQWKNYRGGTCSRIWIFDVASRSVVQVPQPEGRCNDTDPMWVAGRLCFRSDRGGEFDLYAYDAGSKAVERLTQHDDFPIVNASSGGGRIAFEQAGWLHLFDTASARSARVPIHVACDCVETRPRFVQGEGYVRSADLSPSGARAALAFRGEILTVPAEKGDPRHLTNTPAANERFPAWSPDGKTIAYVSDESGENQIVLAPQDGRGERRVLAPGGAGFYESLRWSPDGKKLAFLDNARVLSWLDVESGVVTRIAAEPIYGVYGSMQFAWSPDSRWIAYTLATATNFRRLHLYELASDRSQAITDGLSDVSEAVFDAGGKYLYVAASTDAGPFLTWFAQSSADIEQTNALYLVVLAQDTPSPLARESDEEEAEEAEAQDGDDAAPGREGEKESDEGTQEEAEKKPAGKSDEQPVEVKIDLEGLAQRIVALPLPAAFYSSLQAGDAGQLYYLKAERGAFSDEPPAADLSRFDLEKREEKLLLAGVTDFTLSGDHEKVLLRTADGMWITALGDTVDTSKGRLALDAIQVKIDPRAEWRQIFEEAWRINRDWFYDPDMHGADWPAMKAKYEVFLPHLAVRSDLNRVIRWMCSEIAVGHHRVFGGDTLVEAERVPGGLLGADYEIADGRYRFAKVYGGLNWNPDLRAPLTEPGVDVRAGEYLLAVDGVELRPPQELYQPFENTADKLVELTVGPNPDGSGSRTVKVVPVASEAALRNRDWVEGNIRYVTERTNGRVAYVYVPNTADLGHLYFKRYFFPQADRQAIIVDERHNGGGAVADYYIDILRRPYVSSWATRYGEDFATPQAAIFGPKVMLIDETAGSGGDLLPWMFRKFGLGKLVGRRTWGGLVGILGFPELMDGGEVTAPNLGFWTEEEGFGVENVGVPPDVEVEQWPSEVMAGRDPQLDQAIEIVLAELATNPPKSPVRPPFPVRVRK